MISVIIPVHNVEPYLSRCIESVLNNTYKDIEIILVENGSTDNSLAICREYEKTYSNIKLIVSDIVGLSHVRNVGLDSAEGEWITFVDADDYVSKELYQTLIGIATDADADFVSCEIETGYEENYDFSRAEKRYTVKNRIQFFYELYLKSLQSRSSVCSKLFKKELITDIYFDETLLYFEDRTFVCRAASCSAKIVCATDSLYYYYRGNNTSISKGDIGGKKFLDKRMHQLYSLQKDLSCVEEAFPDKPIYREYISACLLQNADLRLRKAKEAKREDHIIIIKPIRLSALKTVKKAQYLNKKDKLRFLWEHYDYRTFHFLYKILTKAGLK